jgi:hypothetical protein
LQLKKSPNYTAATMLLLLTRLKTKTFKPQNARY